MLSARATLPLRRLPPVYSHLDVSEMESQVLDGVRQAAAIHPVACRMAADGGQLLGRHAGQQRLGLFEEDNEARA